jgi:hypothetical protein
MKLNGDMIWSSLRLDLHRALRNGAKGPWCLLVGNLRIIHKLTSTIQYHNMCPQQDKVRRINFYLFMFYMDVRAVVEEQFITYKLQNHNID